MLETVTLSLPLPFKPTHTYTHTKKKGPGKIKSLPHTVQRSLYRTYVCMCFYVWTEAKVWNEAYIYIKKKVPRNPTTYQVGGDGEVDMCQEAKVSGEEREGKCTSNSSCPPHSLPVTRCHQHICFFSLSFIRRLGLRCLDVLGQPAEPFTITLPLENTAHKHLQWACCHF